MYVSKVISGGQTGADQGGLYAARDRNIATGGWAPRGYRTENGSEVELLKGFGLKEASSSNYTWRTEMNVRDSDLTLLFATKPTSSGSLKTMEYCLSLGKPFFFVKTLHVTESKLAKLIKYYFMDYYEQERPLVLNIAGNRESVSPGIQEFTRRFLSESFTYL